MATHRSSKRVFPLASGGLRRLAMTWIEPTIGLEYAALVDGALIDRALKRLQAQARTTMTFAPHIVFYTTPAPGRAGVGGRESTHYAT